jgi:hypothetical protein
VHVLVSARAWRKSSYSVNEVNCVEVGDLAGGGRAVRDSKNPTGPALRVSGAQWAAFTVGVGAGEFD